jgi:hypothetical protein
MSSGGSTSTSTLFHKKKKKPWVQTTHKYNLWDKIFHEQKLYGIADDDNKMHTGASKSS